MNDIQQGLINFLPPRRKQTPSGWISFNSPCCHHKGERPDTRQRGGVLLTEQNGWNYHCFNCGFKTGWAPGRPLSKNTRQLFEWLGMPQNYINELILTALKITDSNTTTKKSFDFRLNEKPLPDNCKPLTEWSQDPDPKIQTKLLEIIDYLVNQRGMNIDWYPWHYSPEAGYQDRIILPFYQDSRIVGWTARKITPGSPKYITHSQPGYVFNIDQQTADKKYVIITEGQFDAIAIDGVAVMSNEMNETQIQRVKLLNKEVIVVPDNDRAGSQLLNTAIDENWSVSRPNWAENIKDVADAVANYGRLYTLFTILHYRTDNRIKIHMLQKKLES